MTNKPISLPRGSYTEEGYENIIKMLERCVSELRDRVAELEMERDAARKDADNWFQQYTGVLDKLRATLA